MLKRLLINLGVLMSIAVLGVMALEFAAGRIWHKKYNQWLTRQLHGYDYVDEKRSIVLPKPNTVKTVARYREDLVAYNKTLGLRYFEETIREDAYEDSVVLFRINKHGFKGPDFEIPKPPSVFRILTLGNSCTWGPPTDFYSYPRVVEREINSLISEPFEVEVVNAGAYGYNFERVLKRIDEYLAVEPDLVTIYLGWNRTVSRADPARNQRLYRSLALYRLYYHFLLEGAERGLGEDFKKTTYYNPSEPSVAAYRTYSFDYDVADLDKLVGVIRRRSPGTRVVIITLAGLIDGHVEPDKSAIKKAYPITSTDNLYAYAVLTEKWNSELRGYARAHNIPVIDFEKEARGLFNDRGRFFVDSVHLTEEGYEMMGAYIAAEIVKHAGFNKPPRS